ncbi:MAG: YkgJ family cysteine cluster protein [Bacteroidales bacterium]|nr:YkgJ family cysteine cluster protein [Bacteroidales bacterium]
MDQTEIDKIFYRDGYRMAQSYLDQELSSVQMGEAIKALYSAVDELLEAFLQRAGAEGKPVSCIKGCAWCCYQEVFAITHEFLYLNEYVNKSLSEADRISVLERAREKVKISMNLTVEEQLKVRSACPFLDSGTCMVYEARPMACRIYLSASEPSCKKEHDQPSDKRSFPGLFDFPLRAGRMMNEGFVAWLKKAGLQVSELPIEQGYSSMLNFGQTMKEWVNIKEI